MTLHELMEKRPKSQPEVMLVQAIAALSVQQQFWDTAPEDIFRFIAKTCQQWDYEYNMTEVRENE